MIKPGNNDKVRNQLKEIRINGGNMHAYDARKEYGKGENGRFEI